MRESMDVVRPAVAGRSPHPALGSVLIEARADGLTLSATDSEVGIRHRLPDAIPEAEGVALVNPDRLRAILGEAPTGDVRLTLGKTFDVVTPTADYTLPLCDPNGFPWIEEPAGDATLAVDAGGLAAVVSLVSFAAAKDDGKYAMRAVYWHAQVGALSLVATDGKRLAISDMSGGGNEANALVPPKAMGLLERVAGDGTVRVWLGKTTASFATDTTLIHTRLVEGRFPPYRDAIPKKAPIKIAHTAGAMLSHVRQAAVMTEEESKRVAFAFKPGRLDLTAEGQTTGKASVRMPLEYDGPAVAINLDPGYVIDFLKRLPADTPLTLSLIDGKKPAVWRWDGGLHLIVPLV